MKSIQLYNKCVVERDKKASSISVKSFCLLLVFFIEYSAYLYVHQFLAIWAINGQLDRLTFPPNKSSADEITSIAVKFWL